VRGRLDGGVGVSSPSRRWTGDEERVCDLSRVMSAGDLRAGSPASFAQDEQKRSGAIWFGGEARHPGAASIMALCGLVASIDCSMHAVNEVHVESSEFRARRAAHSYHSCPFM
jgi:hypothetical protein